VKKGFEAISEKHRGGKPLGDIRNGGATVQHPSTSIVLKKPSSKKYMEWCAFEEGPRIEASSTGRVHSQTRRNRQFVTART